jgi:hypothetical protein
MTALQKSLVTTAVAVLVGAGIYEYRQVVRLRVQNQALLQQLAPLAEQVRQLQSERDAATNQLAPLLEENVRLKGTQNELLRLRGEVGRLRPQLESGTNQVSQQPAPPNATPPAAGHTPGSYISKDQLANAGYATPEAAAETMTWALLKGTFEQAIEVMSPKMLAKELQDPNIREDFEAGKAKAATTLKGIQIVARRVLADDKVELKIRVDQDPVAMSKLNMSWPPDWVTPMVRVGDAWKVDGQDQPYQAAWDQEGRIQSFTPN